MYGRGSGFERMVCLVGCWVFFVVFVVEGWQGGLGSGEDEDEDGDEGGDGDGVEVGR